MRYSVQLSKGVDRHGRPQWLRLHTRTRCGFPAVLACGFDGGRCRRGRSRRVVLHVGEPEKSPPTLPENALITLGVQAGPPPVPNKTGISSALKIGDDVYQIDCGLGSLNAFTNAGLKFDNLKSMFITHLHTDHLVDYGSFLFSGGYTASKGKAPVTVYGPGPAGGLPPSQVGNADPADDRPARPDAGVGRDHRSRCSRRSPTPTTSSSATWAPTTFRNCSRSPRSPCRRARTISTGRRRPTRSP